jgi:hypothetical protein
VLETLDAAAPRRWFDDEPRRSRCRAAVVVASGGGELVTLLSGADAPPGVAADLPAHATARWPFVEVRAFDGGEPRHPLPAGVE